MPRGNNHKPNCKCGWCIPKFLAYKEKMKRRKKFTNKTSFNRLPVIELD